MNLHPTISQVFLLQVAHQCAVLGSAKMREIQNQKGRNLPNYLLRTDLQETEIALDITIYQLFRQCLVS